MTDQTAKLANISFLRGLAGVVVAILFYLLGCVILTVVGSFPIYLLRLAENFIVETAFSVVVSVGAMWFARSATDWSMKRYSGRAVFVVFLAFMLIAATMLTMRFPFGAELGADYVEMAAVTGAAYFWFWRRESETAETISARGENAMASVATVLGCLPGTLYLAYGLIQYSAVVAQIHSFTHLNGFFSAILSLILTYFPVVGSIIGFFGAKDVWGWHWWQAALLYLGLPVGLYILLFLGNIVAVLVQGMMRPKGVR